MMHAGSATTAVSTFSFSGITSEHYKSRLDAAKGILETSGSEAWKVFRDTVIPQIDKMWSDHDAWELKREQELDDPEGEGNDWVDGNGNPRR